MARLYSGTVPRETGERRRRGRRGWGTPLRVIGIGACALVLVVAAAGLAGGLEEVPPEELPAVAVDERSEGEPYHVTVASAGLVGDVEVTSLPEGADHWLLVFADVEVTSQESRADVRDALFVSGIDGLLGDQTLFGYPEAVLADTVLRARDDGRVSMLHPGLPERLAFLWGRRSGDRPPPAEIDVVIVSKTLRKASLNNRMMWLDDTPRAKVTVPLQDVRDGP